MDTNVVESDEGKQFFFYNLGRFDFWMQKLTSVTSSTVNTIINNPNLLFRNFKKLSKF